MSEAAKLTDELKPCPFCGDGEPVLMEVTWIDPHGYAVSCDDCGAMGSTRLTAEFAIDAWNMRSSLPPDAAGEPTWLRGDDLKLIVDALMQKHIHHVEHAHKYGHCAGFEGHEPMAQRCKALADSIMAASPASTREPT